MRLITIEFLEDTYRDEIDDSGETVQVPVRAQGERVHVDPRSAKSLCDVKGVAKRVGTTTDDDKSAQQVPAVTGDVDTPSSETPDATGTEPVEPAASTKRSRGSSTASS